MFELTPKAGDHSASVSEFLLLEMELVYISGLTLINKTLPRLLELSQNAQTILVGTSCPLCSTLFHHGIDVLAGTLYHQILGRITRRPTTS
ncbi:Rossmann-like domain-containing protein [Enterococcus faecalis]